MCAQEYWTGKQQSFCLVFLIFSSNRMALASVPKAPSLQQSYLVHAGVLGKQQNFSSVVGKQQNFCSVVGKQQNFYLVVFLIFFGNRKALRDMNGTDGTLRVAIKSNSISLR
jgi:hypothetical protein